LKNLHAIDTPTSASLTYFSTALYLEENYWILSTNLPHFVVFPSLCLCPNGYQQTIQRSFLPFQIRFRSFWYFLISIRIDLKIKKVRSLHLENLKNLYRIWLKKIEYSRIDNLSNLCLQSPISWKLWDERWFRLTTALFQFI
jgi:hypothetical protein